MARGKLGSWDSRTTFVLALAAAAVGFGNLWRFSYLLGTNGGAPFLILYLFCLFGLAVPVMIAEVVVGSHGRGSPVAAIQRAADSSSRYRVWSLVGLLACVTGLLILSYCVVVAGWSLAYARDMSNGVFAAASAVVLGEHFDGFLARPESMVLWQSGFLLLVMLCVGLGVRRGVGFIAWLIVPSLMWSLGLLVTYALQHGDLEATREFMFSIRWRDFSADAFPAALGHAFFTLGIGVGTGICYGAYAPGEAPIGRSVIAVALFDLFTALAAGLALLPIAFANNIEPGSGLGLLFISAPYAFGNMIQGDFFGTTFFSVVAAAALGSAVALLEPIVSFLTQQLRCTRLFAVFISSLAVWLLALVAALSLNRWNYVLWFDRWTFFELLDQVTTRGLLPAVAFGLVLFVGWRMRPAILREELGRESTLFFSLWLGALRYIALPAIILILVLA